MNNNFIIPKILAFIVIIFLIVISATQFNWFGIATLFVENKNPAGSNPDDNTNPSEIALICRYELISPTLEVSHTETFHFVNNQLKQSETTQSVISKDSTDESEFEDNKTIIQFTVNQFKGIDGIKFNEIDVPNAYTANLTFDYTILNVNDLDDTSIPVSLNDSRESIRFTFTGNDYTCN